MRRDSSHGTVESIAMETAEELNRERRHYMFIHTVTLILFIPEYLTIDNHDQVMITRRYPSLHFAVISVVVQVHDNDNIVMIMIIIAG